MPVCRCVTKASCSFVRTRWPPSCAISSIFSGSPAANTAHCALSFDPESSIRRIHFNYLYLCHSDSRNDRRAMHRSHSTAHIDYSGGPNAAGMRKQRMNIDRGRCTSGTIHGMFYTSVSSDRRTVNRGTPCTGHRPACNAPGMRCILMGRHLFVCGGGGGDGNGATFVDVDVGRDDDGRGAITCIIDGKQRSRSKRSRAEKKQIEKTHDIHNAIEFIW